MTIIVYTYDRCLVGMHNQISMNFTYSMDRYDNYLK